MLPLLFCFCFFILFIVCKLWILACIFTVWTALDIDQLVFYTTSWMCGLEGKFGQEYKEGTFDNEVKSRNQNLTSVLKHVCEVS